MSKKVLLDTNVVVHRESYNVSHIAVRQLYRWFDKLKYTKCIHPVTEKEFRSHKNPETVKTMGIKMEAYVVLQTTAPIHPAIQQILDYQDRNDNDRNDSLLLNEVIQERVDAFVTEDRKIHNKATQLNIADKVFTISHFVENAIADYPELVNYKVLSVEKVLFGNIDVNDQFFDSFRADYAEFNKWFNSKSEEVAYVCYAGSHLVGFLYIKREDPDEDYNDIVPSFGRRRRLKIGTLKVALNGYRIGERFLKIVFDNALVNKVDEIYVTLFNRTPEQVRLIETLEEWGFIHWGSKQSKNGREMVFCRDFQRMSDRGQPKVTFPFMSKNAGIYFVPIWPAYHTQLLPDSILNTESPDQYKDNEPFRNALNKIYISHSYERGLKKGDVIVFYRTGGKYTGVVTTLGIVEQVHDNLKSTRELFEVSRKKTFLTETQLQEFWDRYKTNKPFAVEFLYAYSFPKRPILAELVELGIISDVMSVPRGFRKITLEQLYLILKASKSDESIIVD